MTNREEILPQFGPKLIESIINATLNEINTLRTNAGLPAKTIDDFLTFIKTDLPTLEDYDWQKDDFTDPDNG